MKSQPIATYDLSFQAYSLHVRCTQSKDAGGRYKSQNLLLGQEGDDLEHSEKLRWWILGAEFMPQSLTGEPRATLKQSSSTGIGQCDAVGAASNGQHLMGKGIFWLAVTGILFRARQGLAPLAELLRPP